MTLAHYTIRELRRASYLARELLFALIATALMPHGQLLSREIRYFIISFSLKFARACAQLARPSSPLPLCDRCAPAVPDELAALLRRVSRKQQ
jgi:hypothetical protein